MPTPAAAPHADLDPTIVDLLRDYPAQVGWLAGDLARARTSMTAALPVLKRGRGYEAKQAASELEFSIEGIARTFAYIEAADRARRAEIDARLAALGTAKAEGRPS